LAAVKQNPEALQYVKTRTPEIIREAIASSNLNFVNKYNLLNSEIKEKLNEKLESTLTELVL